MKIGTKVRENVVTVAASVQDLYHWNDVSTALLGKRDTKSQ